MSSSPLLEAIRSKTADAHRSLEDQLDLISPALSLDIYIHTLRVFEAFVTSWEAQATANCPNDLAEFIVSRHRATLLVADLKFFGVERLKEKPVLPSVGTRSSFLGAMYVMEGSTLGGQIISRHLQSMLGLSNSNGYRYFSGYGAATGEMWRAFLKLLADEAPLLVEMDVVSTAQKMFESFQNFHGQLANKQYPVCESGY
jgi:heme oxygenase (biliverdin-IX-beta and delta-forming)